MRLFRISILVTAAFSLKASGQNLLYKSLLDTAIIFKGQLFVSKKPITRIQHEKEEIREYLDFLSYSKNNSHTRGEDSLLLLDLIENSKALDSTFWTDTELDKFFLINNRADYISLKEVTQKFGLSNKTQLKYYRDEVRHFNSAEPVDRDIYYYSRPVFDSSKKFAILEWDDPHSYLGGGGGIKLYQLIGDSWRELGNVIVIKY